MMKSCEDNRYIMYVYSLYKVPEQYPIKLAQL